MKNKGFTLVELLVSITLFSIIIAIAVGAFTNALRTQRQVAAIINAQSNVSLAIEQMAREIRTGYLFCHDVNGAPTCTCVGGGPCGVVPAGETRTTVDLNFYNAVPANVVYSLQNGMLMKSDSSVGGAPQPLTSDTVSVKYLNFVISKNLEGDHWTPRITISLGIAPSSTDPGIANDVLNLQTSISARAIDCDTTVVPVAC
jgi:prepilin-type N-terminal cleavage/methylation domain-containing protein